MKKKTGFGGHFYHWIAQERDFDTAVFFGPSAKGDCGASAFDTGECAGAGVSGEEETAKVAGRSERYTALTVSGKFPARIYGAIRFYGNDDWPQTDVLTETQKNAAGEGKILCRED